MADALSFKIENGVFALAVVETAEVGYADDWQAPAGKSVDQAVLADYEAAAAQWSCQIQTATIDATAQTNDETVDATWCAASKTVPNPGETSFAINGTFVADTHVQTGLWAFLYANDTKEAYFLMGLNGEASPPKAIGRVRVTASSFGGAGRVTLTATLNGLPLSRRYDAWVGQAPPGLIIEGNAAAVMAAAASSPTSPPVESEAA
jgi:hypothetical protein